ncbi:L-isoaspartyl protein carboxyl methyltransferase [Methanocaldococcus bathoardescens]|uniref:L-isoaspartyl protein carboxyl methyltransferase n=1 Tax=Methanocaldococcus bathoardescens TaxID=1301915 RepID=A0A076LBQ9_9EURY|nr:tRNA (adenine-N1)-methyltransferase [Methanocaldococcus bathoardescens]AIJ05586.1 L-isoaspartyl protein carboxyl methyltransferase [Methanocaldococcus bathoardescens]
MFAYKLLVDERGKRYLLKKNVEKFGTDLGIVDMKDVEEGTILKSHKGHTFYLVEPTMFDILKRMKRTVTTLLPKDIGFIIARAGIREGETVVEAGTGSGALTMYLSNAVGKTGKVITYDIRPEFAKVARKNLLRVGAIRKGQKIIGLDEEFDDEDEIEVEDGLFNVIQKIGDVREKIDEKDVDVIVLDLPDPWNVVENAKKALNKKRGRIVTYLPYIEQVKKTVEKLKEEGFWDIHTYEIIEREIEISEKGVRPSTRMIGHTGYITVARVPPEPINENEEEKEE